FVSTGNGPFTRWLQGTTQTSDTYHGTSGNRYNFYSIATDNVGNVQPTPAQAQTTTFVLVPLTISGMVFQDINTDGLQEPNEPGIAGQPILLDQGGTESTTTTDASGNYQFSVMSPGTYT